MNDYDMALWHYDMGKTHLICQSLAEMIVAHYNS